jgi:hypothetical protein
MAATKARWVNSRLTLYGGPIEFSTGAYIVNENVFVDASTAAATVKNYGLTVINTTYVRTLAAPEDGSVVDLLFYGTTLPITVKTTGALFNRQTKQDVFTVTLSTAASKASGHHVRLVGEGTTNWWMLTPIGMQTSGLTNAVALSSDT